MASDARYEKQLRLQEIGPSGQAALAGARVRVPADAAGVLQAMYLHRAGIGQLTLTILAESPSFRHAECFRHAAARTFAEGAWRALAEIRRIARVEDP